MKSGLLQHYNFIHPPTSEQQTTKMKIFIIASLFLAGIHAAPMLEAKTETPMDIAEVDLVQDIQGNYRLMYRDRNVTRTQEGFQDGRVIGSYDYIDFDGVKHTIKFVASADGYTAEGADIPVMVQETDEVAEARAVHMAIMEKQLALLPKLLLEEETTVDPQEVIAKLIVPEIMTLPYAPKESEDIMMAKNALLEAHASALLVMLDAYKMALMKH